jgi:glutaminase
MWPLIGSDAADAASSRVGAEPAGKPAVPVRRVGAEPAGKPAVPVRRAGAVKHLDAAFDSLIAKAKLAA